MEEERLDRFIDIGRLDVFMQLHGGAERERERDDRLEFHVSLTIHSSIGQTSKTLETTRVK